MLEIEVRLARTLGWSLHDIDETDVSHLLGFIAHLTGATPAGRARTLSYIDQVDWR